MENNEKMNGENTDVVKKIRKRNERKEARVFRLRKGMKTRNLIIILLIVALAGTVFFGYMQTVQAASYKTNLNNMYAKSFEDLSQHIETINNDITKLKVVSSNEQWSLLLMNILKTSSSASDVLGQLPSGIEAVGGMTAFINRLGDYCYMLNKRMLNGNVLKPEDIQQIDTLTAEVSNLMQQINNIASDENTDYTAYAQKNIFIGEETENISGAPEFKSDISYPSLLYDGPFSESTENKEPKELRGEEYTKDKAKEVATGFYQGRAVNIDDGGDLDGKIYAYGFTGQLQGGGTFDIYITKIGGKVLWSYESLPVQQDVTVDAALQQRCYASATDFLAKLGYANMKPNYWQHYDGVGVINFAPVENGTVLYPDIVKVWVDLKENRAIGIDANHYIMSHYNRTLPAAAITIEDARATVAQRMEIVSEQIALIPLEDNSESLCYEFSGKSGADEFLFYINAVTGKEEDVLQIIHAPNGQMVM